MATPVEFGYNRGLPESVTTAWGARTIANGDFLDLLHDRQGTNGGPRKDELLAYLAEHAPWKLISDQAHLVRGDSDDEIVFFEDDKVIVKGSAQRSGGYCYLVAYFKDEVTGTDDSAGISVDPDWLDDALDAAAGDPRRAQKDKAANELATGTHPLDEAEES